MSGFQYEELPVFYNTAVKKANTTKYTPYQPKSNELVTTDPSVFEGLAGSQKFGDFGTTLPASTNTYSNFNTSSVMPNSMWKLYTNRGDSGYLDGLRGVEGVPTDDLSNDMYKNYMQQKMDYMTGANAMKWEDVGSISDAGKWLTDNRGGGQSYLDMGLGALSALTQGYGAYKSGEYQDKIAGLQEGAQKFYEQQVKAQDARRAEAQKRYEDAQA